MTGRKKALVLSGGGGRGAYHVGVIEALVERGWMKDGKGPDIIAGTSIGAVNGAALASGLTVAQLKDCWLRMHTEDVHRLSDSIPLISRPLVSFLLRSVLTSQDHGDTDTHETAEIQSMSAGDIYERLRQVFRKKPFRSLLDNRPWRRTLSRWMDFDRINSDEAPALLLAATCMETGTLTTFCNQRRPAKGGAQQMIDATPLTIDHIIASCSIPAVYPWTEIQGSSFWDGAVVANTPLSPVISLAQGQELEVIVVMMTPWHATESELAEQFNTIPIDLVQMLALTLDWALLASYRIDIKMLKTFNRLAEAAKKLDQIAQNTNDPHWRLSGPTPCHIAEPVVISPESFMPLEWIIDYERANHEYLFELGRKDTHRILDQRHLEDLLTS